MEAPTDGDLARFVAAQAGTKGAGAINSTLSAITTCLAMFGHHFNVSRAVRIQVKGIKRKGPAVEQRLPLCPHDWLPAHLSVGEMSLELRRAVCMITLTQYFGWRSSTVVQLEVAKVKIRTSTIEVQSTFFKNVGPTGLPCGVISLSKRPDLMKLVVGYVRGRK